MDHSISTLIDSEFKKDVYQGLTAHPKFLLSKYIYDSEGDRLFQEIMKLPEYYLTNAEFEIFQRSKREICALFEAKDGFDLIELGAGDGKKTKVLLQYLVDRGNNFSYKPIDISENAIQNLESSLKNELPKLDVSAEIGSYFEVLDRLQKSNQRKKVILFLGSNIGNLLHPKAIEFLKGIRGCMNRDDLLFVGFDQKKNPQTILDAYNDPAGVTAAFNKNLLSRINSELGGNFDLDHFKHWEVYDPESGTAKSYLISTKQQQVIIDELELIVDFEAWESIHTEISQKYDDRTIEWLAEQSGLRIETSFEDSNKLYRNYVFRSTI